MCFPKVIRGVMLLGLSLVAPGAALSDATRVPPEIVAEIDKLVNDDLDVYLAARRKVLAHGPACNNLVVEQLRKLDPQKDQRLFKRLRLVQAELERQVILVDVERAVDAALRRADEFGKKRDVKRRSRITVLMARELVGKVGDYPSDNTYQVMSYFSFPKNKHTFAHGGVSLYFGNELAAYNNTGIGNRIKSLGKIDYASVKTAPSAETTKAWERDRREALPLAPGQVFIEHCLEPDRGIDDNKIDLTVKFQVLDVSPGQWVIIEWEPIPQDK